MLDTMDIADSSSPAASPAGFPASLTFVYDADGTFRGEVTYIVGHLLGRLSCSMCDISHGPLGRKRAWVAWADTLATHQINVVTTHRDELDPEVAAVIQGFFPAVVATDHDGSHCVVMTKAQLETCDGRIDKLASHLEAIGLVPTTAGPDR